MLKRMKNILLLAFLFPAGLLAQNEFDAIHRDVEITRTADISAGSAGTPSLTFTGDLNTGFYAVGADSVAISTGGSGRLFVNGSANITVNLPLYAADGAAATPSYTFGNDTNTGLYLAGADSVALGTNGIERLLINTTNLIVTLDLNMSGNDIGSFDQLQTTDATTLTPGEADATITITQMYHAVTAFGSQTLDSVATINGGSAGSMLILNAADTDDIFIDVDGGNITGTDRTLNGTGDTWFGIFDGTNWTEISFADND